MPISPSRVARPLKHIDSFATIESAQKDERYWLTPFEHALAVANKGQVRIVMGDRR